MNALLTTQPTPPLRLLYATRTRGPLQLSLHLLPFLQLLLMLHFFLPLSLAQELCLWRTGPPTQHSLL